MKAIRIFTAMVMGLVIMMCARVSASADDGTVTLYLTGKQYYDKAQEILKIINEERASKGLGALTLDRDLTKAAMLRAAEAAVIFSHTRPNGKSYYSLNERISGENLAGDRVIDPHIAFDLWKTSKAGHYENMLKSRWTSTGIGVFEHNGSFYWAQVFSSSEAKVIETSTVSGQITYPIEMRKDTLSSNLMVRPKIHIDSYYNRFTMQKSFDYEMIPCMKNPGWSSEKAIFDKKGFTWKSSDPSIVSVNGSTATTVASGEATVSGEINGVSATFIFAVPEGPGYLHDANWTFVNYNPEYTGKPKTPKVEGKIYGKTLYEGKDFTVSYKNNIYPGYATLTITGIGDFTGTYNLHYMITPSTTKATATTTQKVTAKQTTKATTKQTVEVTTKQTTMAKASTTTAKVASAEESTTTSESLTTTDYIEPETKMETTTTVAPAVTNASQASTTSAVTTTIIMTSVMDSESHDSEAETSLASVASAGEETSNIPLIAIIAAGTAGLLAVIVAVIAAVRKRRE